MAVKRFLKQHENSRKFKSQFYYFYLIYLFNLSFNSSTVDKVLKINLHRSTEIVLNKNKKPENQRRVCGPVKPLTF